MNYFSMCNIRYQLDGVENAILKHVLTTEKDTARNSYLWAEVDQRLQDLGLSAYPRVIVHDRWYLAKILGKKHYFFNDIFTEGVVLFDSGVFKPVIREKLTSEERVEVALEHFDHWFTKSRVFFEDFETNFDKASKGKEYLNQAAFLLQQAAECAYKTLLLVHTNYTPYNHYLAWYDEAIQEVIPDLPDFFPRETKEAKERFKNFDYAYIGARYSPSYHISKADLQYFAQRVEFLMSETESRCRTFLQTSPNS